MATRIVDTVEAQYRAKNPLSSQLHASACEWMPGGTTRTSTYFSPYPLYMVRGQGTRVWDVDGNERIDFINNYSALILGHGHPAVLRAIEKQLHNGTAFAAANPFEVELARIMCERVPSLESIRFTNSGTEATMFAIRVARACTGKQRFARIEGGYHGTHDLVEVSTHPDPALAGDPESPVPVRDSIGTLDFALQATVVLPFNNLQAAQRILTENADSLAAVIVEPVLGAGGVIPAEPAFLAGLRELTTRLGILLIFDEVITIRLSTGGAQQLYGVTPDLTTLAKVIGGGLPVAAFGGRAEYMQVLDPQRENHVEHAGNYNGNPLGMVAGIATMNELTPEVFEELNRKGQWVRDQLQSVFTRHHVQARVTGIGSLFNVHFTDRDVRDYRAAASSDRKKLATLFLELVNRGILLAPRAMGALSTPMEQDDLDRLITAVDEAVVAHARDWSSSG